MNTVKIPPSVWIDAAKNALISGGVAGVKVERLAKKLGVTRGGFYHHFNSRGDLLAKLLAHWEVENRFLPVHEPVHTPSDAISVFQTLVASLIREERFSPAFEMAVRDWSRVDGNVLEVVERIDHERMNQIAQWFTALGYEGQEASVRSRVFYLHQIGYYTLRYDRAEPVQERLKSGATYLRILCGRRYAEAAEKSACAPG